MSRYDKNEYVNIVNFSGNQKFFPIFSAEGSTDEAQKKSTTNRRGRKSKDGDSPAKSSSKFSQLKNNIFYN